MTPLFPEAGQPSDSVETIATHAFARPFFLGSCRLADQYGHEPEMDLGSKRSISAIKKRR
jgi:hypothetical protein